MKIIVIGAVAAGTSAAAKARRNDDAAEITIYEKDQNISYSGCGLPYYIGNEIEDISELTPRDPAFFKKKYNIDVKIRHEVLSIDPEQKTLVVRDLLADDVFEDHYDKLVLATGAKAFIPQIDGVAHDHVFSLRNVQDAVKIKDFIETAKPRTAVIAGTGFIGFEMLENLMAYDMDVTVIEVMDKITPNLDKDMSVYLENLLISKGVKVLKGTRIDSITDAAVTLNDGKNLDADMVILATGVRPNVELATEAGVALGVTGAIKVDTDMSTNVEDIYACGDCIETFSQVSNAPVYHPLGSTANKTGRIAGDALTGGPLRYRATWAQASSNSSI